MANRVLIKHNRNWGLESLDVEKSMQKVLKDRKLDGVEVSIIFVGRKRAKELNVNYRKMTYIPQVLGFPLKREVDPDGWIRLGDVVICTQKLKDETVVQKKSAKEVLNEWLEHGLDNLLKDEGWGR